MDLFTPIVSDERLHHNFSQILQSAQLKDRQELSRWAEGFPDRDNKLVIEFQTTFNSTFWEIYLFALFKELDFELDWTHAAPDFSVNCEGVSLVIEATTASAALGKTPEWEKKLEEGVPKRFKKMNIESMVRLANSISSKHEKYNKSYKKLEHVKGKPFVIAVAPFEQPYFNMQYDVPIMALLYDYYVDEDAFNDAPHKYPYGPPGVNLGTVTKDNGAEIELGIFKNGKYSDISAIMLSTTATWGKVEAMSGNDDLSRFVTTSWWPDGGGPPIHKLSTSGDFKENIRDGLVVLHNPFTDKKIAPDIFRKSGIVQVFYDPDNQTFTKEINGPCLFHRQTLNLIPRS
ncbi:hypothetical protein [Desulfobacter vibrioformis]|uniref:hypothetical protein n=1 Tax=Desulfobacter vibrioformis TaxID=34031 RepID=UPI0005518740|nr:hypothetical protein [Desulfobacter vibrioformis]